MRSATSLGIGFLAALCLAGCSGSTATSDGTSAGGTGSSSRPTTSTSSATSSATSAETTSTGAADTVATGDLCEFLEGRLPALRKLGLAVGRQANLAIGLADFYENHEKLTDATALDAAVKQGCPEVRTELLKLLEMDSLAEL